MSDSVEEQALAPIQQSREAFDWLRIYGDDRLESSIQSMADDVRAIAPDCVAVSVAVAHGELTFTLTADRHGAALLDAIQYLDDGPCVEAISEQETVATKTLPTDEERWRIFAAAEALTGIASTLSMPIMRANEVIGGVNLYGATKDAFDGLHEELAKACGTWAEGAVANADLEFTSRVRAAATRDRLMDRGDVDIASGVVAESQDVSTAVARQRIQDAATRAGVSAPEFARFILEAHNAGLA